MPKCSCSLLLGTLPDADPRSLAFAINDHGNIVGTVYRGDNHLARAYLWTEDDGMKAPVDVFHLDVVIVSVLPDVVDGDHVRVNERGGVPGLVEEHRNVASTPSRSSRA